MFLTVLGADVQARGEGLLLPRPLPSAADGHLPPECPCPDLRLSGHQSGWVRVTPTTPFYHPPPFKGPLWKYSLIPGLRAPIYGSGGDVNRPTHQGDSKKRGHISEAGKTSVRRCEVEGGPEQVPEGSKEVWSEWKVSLAGWPSGKRGAREGLPPVQLCRAARLWDGRPNKSGSAGPSLESP